MYKKWFQNKKAIFFDLDGTIIKSQELWKEAVIETLKNKTDTYSYDPEKYIQSGETIKEKWKTLKDIYGLKKLNIKKTVEETENKFMELVQNKGIKVTEGFWEFSAELKVNRNYLLGLNTNSSRRVTDFILDFLGMREAFNYSICGDEVNKPKPNPKIYRKLLKKMHLKKREILVFEDSVVGSKAAIKAKLNTVIIWDMKTEKYKYPHKVLGFVANFETFLGLMDKTSEELLLQGIQEANQNT